MEPIEQHPNGHEPASTTVRGETVSSRICREYPVRLTKRQKDHLFNLERRTTRTEEDVLGLAQLVESLILNLVDLAGQIERLLDLEPASDDDSVTTDEEEENPS